jgi:hypothetical protein
VIYLGFFTLVYAPVILVTYGYADDFDVLYTSHHSSYSNLLNLSLAGRPIYGVLVQISYTLVSSTAGLRLIRIIGVLGIGGLAWNLYRASRTLNMDARLAFCIPAAICTLPAFELYAAWATASFFPIACILAATSALLLERAWRATSRRDIILAVSGALSLQILATALYQPAAMMCWVVLAMILLLLDAPPRALLLRFAAQALAVGIGLLIDLMFAKIMPSIATERTATVGRTVVAPNPLAKLPWFVTHPLRDALDLWSLMPSTKIAFVVAVFTAGGLAVFVSGTRRVRVLRLVLAVVLVPLAFLPNLIVAESDENYRTQVALTSLICLYVVLAAIGCGRIIWPRLLLALDTTQQAALRQAAPRHALGALVLATATFGLVATYVVTADFALPNALDYTVLKGVLSRIPLDEIEHLYVRQSCVLDTASPVQHFEFGIPSSAISWAIGPMTKLALQDFDPSLVRIGVTVVPPSATVTPEPGAALVDMRALGTHSPVLSSQTLRRIGC